MATNMLTHTSNLSFHARPQAPAGGARRNAIWQRAIWLAKFSLAMLPWLAASVSAQDAATKQQAADPQARPVARANTFLATLSSDERAKALLPIESELRVQWHFIPMATRKGLPLMEMNPVQREAAMNLLKSCVSPAGYAKAKQIMELEKVLKSLEGEGGPMERNPVKYYFTVFGTPQANQRWGLSVEGHHLSLNFVFQGNRIIDSTPQFFAANPAQLKTDFGDLKQGLEVLRPEEQLAFELLRSLTATQRGRAILPGATPSEIYSAGTPQPPATEPQGLPAAELDQRQRELLKQLLTTYTSKMKRRVAEQRWQLIEEAGLDRVHFGWSGGDQSGKGHYYVIHGPTFFVEFINVQPDAAGNPANHIHCVWRDATGDFDLPLTRQAN
ncbi:MAG: DUF3500 domain-containing protein [Pirellulaceae bacterium]|nr:DUF3500 domain-containing protein [Pirellulaceae bacterium]